MLLFFYPLFVSAQAADTMLLRVFYSTGYKIYASEKAMRFDNSTVLDVGNGYSRFYSMRRKRSIEVFDSVYAHGGTVYDGMDACRKENVFSGPVNCDILKGKPADGVMTYQYLLGDYVYEEPIPKYEWTYLQGDTIIAGYSCGKAVAAHRGRTWTVWYSLEIPVADGPWKLGGLPGLILLAEDARHDFSFSCIGIENGNGRTMYSTPHKNLNTSTPEKMEDMRWLKYANEEMYDIQKYGAPVVRYDKYGRRVKRSSPYVPPCFIEYYNPAHNVDSNSTVAAGDDGK